jgi:cytoskeletal protein CcmA (bactofilin family)
MTTAIMRCERGVALLAAVLLALVLSALGTALTVSSQTEVAVVRNHQRAAEARAAVEAGLSHAAQLTVRRLNAWQANGFANPRAAITDLLRGPDNAISATAGDPANADNGSLEALEIAGETELPRLPAVVALAAMQTSYQARIVDEDDPSRNLSGADRARIAENGQAESDANRKAVLQVTGFAGDNTVVTLEAIIGRNTLPAIVSDGSLTITGNPTIDGAFGGIHSNANLTVAGNVDIADDATATGTYTEFGGSVVIGGDSGGGRTPISVPSVNAADHRGNADFVLTVGVGGGRIRGPFNPDGTLGPVLCDASVNPNLCVLPWGWQYDAAGSGWRVSGVVLTDGTYYVMGNVSISGSPPLIGPPKSLTVIAEGNIRISGSPRIQPDTNGLMFVTDRDLVISGHPVMTAGIEGQILVREQMMISGNPTLNGAILIDNASNLSGLVVNSQIVGSPTITYNGTLDADGFVVSGWREVR